MSDVMSLIECNLRKASNARSTRHVFTSLPAREEDFDWRLPTELPANHLRFLNAE